MKTNKIMTTAIMAVTLIGALSILMSCESTGAGGTNARPEIKELAADIVAGSGSSDPEYFIGHAGAVYFAAEDSSHGVELWKYDGTSATLVEDIYSGSDDSDPDSFVVFDGTLYFQAENSASGMELWKVNSGSDSASLAADINSGAGDGHWGHAVVHDGYIYFQGNDGSNGKNLYRYDGSTVEFRTGLSGTYSSWPAYITVYNNTLYFNAETNSDSELYYYDSASNSMKLPALEEVNPSATGSMPAELLVYDGNLYFEADSGNGDGRELYMYDQGDSDGNNEIYEQITTIRSGGNAQIGDVTVYGTKLYFTANNGVREYIYSYDGNTVTRHDDIAGGHTPYYPGSLEVYDGQLYFSADDGSHGRELWRYNGQNAELVWDINPGSGSSYPYGMTAIDGRLYFNADNGSIGDELFVYQSPK
ncbi:MAG: hypothetical protein U5P10_14510 [Spirochaetia bacterium]|nr:hypothetical protein [Spirochaetia bacterium]